MSFSKYKNFIADQRYSEKTKVIDLPARTVAESVESLIKAIVDLAKELEIPMSIKENGVTEKEFEAKVEELAELAFEDQCTTANPKLPLITELEEVYWNAFKGV